MRPLLVVLSSPSGGGKSTIVRRLLAERDDVTHSVSATTRAPRPGEENGVAYHFISRDEFERELAAGSFVEHAEYGGNLYGTLSREIQRGLDAGRHVLLDIEVVGARQVRSRFPEAVFIFVVPPSGRVLADRLAARGTEGQDRRAVRLQHALDELAAAEEYDYVVVNDELDDAVRITGAILDAESRRSSRQRLLWEGLDRLRNEVRDELAVLVPGN